MFLFVCVEVGILLGLAVAYYQATKAEQRFWETRDMRMDTWHQTLY